ncbi:type I restriction-modification system endonuclease [Natroniella acetigena]|uniref:type I restriction-modification system endonuclease n=1 Tax=Natroniella acetigena TaxID=52004 RepID=UPI00200AA38E|nr:type I restriction-modification system endonuclease [Natroniella acetigena]MCK8827629.1 type I restriction-modification system endonuclease [Natroniella acetigena]
MEKSNFDFLKESWPILANLGELAEQNLYDDPNTTLIKLRMFGEKIVDYMFAYDKLEEPEDDRQFNKLKILKQEGLMNEDILDIFHLLRRAGNKAVHDTYDSLEKAKTVLSLSFKAGVWFMQVYGEWNFEPDEFVLPDESKINEDIEVMRQSYEEELAQLKEKLEAVRQEEGVARETRKKQSRKSASQMDLNEDETRVIIDDKLRQRGWEVDSENLRYSKGTRPEKGRNLAIAEWPIDKEESWPRRADYALFINKKLVGIIEAKRKSKDIPSDLEQAKDYARDIKLTEGEQVGKWGEYNVPFMFATNGRPYLEQIKEKSGIWFLDGRASTNHSRVLPDWYTPEGLMELLEKDKEEANQRLKEEDFDYLRDNSSLSLRDYQVEAIKKVEEAIRNDKREMLLAMATGTGKTRTIIGLAYRLIKAKRFKRILFLVDRTTLGEQAENSFKEATIEDLMDFGSIYDIKSLDDKEPERETKIHISTVQGMLKRVMYSQELEDVPPIDWYDCIIVDEAHRGYLLDKEMSEDELEYRDPLDYISKYRRVIEHFDAIKIGLTATPALHTKKIFGKPVFKYSYRQAVIDGYLVDHKPPHQISTKLSTEGINFKAGEVVPIYDPVTGEIINNEELPDDLDFDVDDFNKKVVTESFNRVVVREVVKDLDPYGEEKTLVFACRDSHADMLVRIFKEEFEKIGVPVDDDAVAKITGSVKAPSEMVRRYKNEQNPNIAITVDLLTTGIDVPKISNLVFLRRVRSRILYEQMLGRATRLADDIGKTHFNIYDAVGLYEGLKKVSNMKPVVANPQIEFTTLLDEVSKFDDKKRQQKSIDEIVAKLQRKKNHLREEEEEKFTYLAQGKDPEEFIDWLKESSVKEVVDKAEDLKSVFSFLDEDRHYPEKQVIAERSDELIAHERGYGKEGKKPEDYLEEFSRFIDENMNKIPALEIACKRPKELTRKVLKELKLELDKHGFNETNLNTAWKEAKNEEIIADIISFIRQEALGVSLMSHEERIEQAMEKVKGIKDWKKVQLNWLERIEKQLKEETVIDKESFDQEPFKSKGGYRRINKIFAGKLDNVLELINENLYQDIG